MPPILDPNRQIRRKRLGSQAGFFGDLRTKDFDYDYPNDLNLRPGFPDHERIVDNLWAFAQQAQVEMSKRHGYWQERDKVLKAFSTLPPSNRRPNETNTSGLEPRIIMPVSYVAMQTFLAYMTTSFLQAPVNTYEGTGPEDILKGILLTAVNQRHVHRYGLGMNYHTAFRDMFAYGVCAAHNPWKKVYGRRVLREDRGEVDEEAGTFTIQQSRRKRGKSEVLFEGNSIDNIDPYLLILDPNAGVGSPAGYEGEFAGWWDYSNLRIVKRWEEGDEGFFNVKYLELVDGRSGLLRSKSRRTNDRSRAFMEANNPVELFWMYVDLIPAEWKLGPSDDPEVWVFVVGADKILLKAEPTDLDQIPIAVGAPNTDGYTTTPVSGLEAVDELQKIVDFLYSSHVANIKQVLYDNIVYDPSLINTQDLNDPRPGKRIRFRKKAWGRTGVKDSIFQLKVEDVTAANVSEALLVSQLIHDALGTQDPIRGQAQPRTTRISAREFGGLQGASLNRLAYEAIKISIQFMQPLARLMAWNTQMFMEQETFIKTTGELEDQLRETFGITDIAHHRLQVKPFDLLDVNYDVAAFNNVVPGSENVDVWTQLFQILGSSPELSQQFDMARILRHIAQQLGAKNVDDFIQRNPPQVRPDEEVSREVERGNLQPITSNGLP